VTHPLVWKDYTSYGVLFQTAPLVGSENFYYSFVSLLCNGPVVLLYGSFKIVFDDANAAADNVYDNDNKSDDEYNDNSNNNSTIH
jgi:hypothetical protein